jgi:tetratricopeptide (TPR) repeat protein
MNWVELLEEAEAARSRGLRHQALQYCHRAARCGEQALREAALLQGRILLELGDATAALSGFESVALLERPDPELDCMRGLALFELGLLPEAEAALQNALKSVPEVAGAHYTLGLIAELLGTGEAEAHFRKARQLEPEAYPWRPNFSRTEFAALVRKATDDLPSSVYNWLKMHPLFVEVLPPVEKFGRVEPRVSPLSLAMFIVLPEQELEDTYCGLMLFKRNFERNFEASEDIIVALKRTIVHEVSTLF